MSGVEDEALGAGVLAEKPRRSPYTMAQEARRLVAQDEAGAAVATSSSLGAFHLGKLVDVGLLRRQFDSGLSLAFVNGLTEGLSAEHAPDAALSPGECCVELRNGTSATTWVPV